MANVIKKGGLRLKDAAVDQPLMTCLHAAGDTVRLGIGDPVKTAGSAGKIASGPYTKTVALVASGDPIFGVVEGVLREFVATGMNLDSRYAPASTAMYVLVRKANHSDVYAISEDGSTPVVNVGLNANLTGNGGGTTVTECDTITGQSTVLLDSTTEAVDADLQVKIIAYEDTPDNTPTAVNASILVQLNNIENSGGTGTLGI